MKKVAIILCTKNGEKFIIEQLNSIDSQSYKDIDIYITDDDSSDSTVKIIEDFPFKNAVVKKFYKKQFGDPAINFLWTLKQIDDHYNMYFFCDQDDIWHKEKIRKYLKLYSPTNKAALICSRTILIDEQSKAYGFSPLFKKKLCLGNALVQSIAGGNTMGFNKATKSLLDRIDNLEDVVSHDWIAYILVSAFGGKIIYLKEPFTYYRSHENNNIGPNVSFKSRLNRLKLLFENQFYLWTNRNLKVLENFELNASDLLKTVNFLKKAKDKNIIERFKVLSSNYLFRQTFLSNIALKLAILLKKA